jgi:hypothetical protein
LFYQKLFKNAEDQATIEKCIKAAHNLVITVETDVKTVRRTVACAVNFANVDNKAIYINWLATSKANVSLPIFKEKFLVEFGAGNFYLHHLATFLLHVSHLIVKIKYEDTLPQDATIPSVPIVLQAKEGDNEAFPYYIHIGFVDIANIESDTEMKTALEYGDKIVDALSASENRTHIIYNHKLFLMVKDDGDMVDTLQLQAPTSKYIPFNLNDQTNICRFPFHVAKEHLLIIASGIDSFIFLLLMKQIYKRLCCYQQNYTLWMRSFKSKTLKGILSKFQWLNQDKRNHQLDGLKEESSTSLPHGKY